MEYRYKIWKNILWILMMEKKIVMKQYRAGGESVYFPLLLYGVEYCEDVHDLNLDFEAADVTLLHRINQIEKNTELYLDEMQKDAVMEAVRHGLMILTGGPGTGKTTTINTLISYFESEGLSVMLGAPTGRAAKRMTEATGCEAKTLHRLLEISAVPENGADRGSLQENQENRWRRTWSSSMRCRWWIFYLMHSLLLAIVPGTRLIMVGDRNQLPSVGPGSVLKDIIESKCFPVVRLNRIFRQATESDIVMNAHKINRGEHVTLDNKSRDSFFSKGTMPT
mgnify:CR=1 FL=1